MPRQLSFDLPVRTALGRGDFFVSSANSAAVALIEAWRDWPGRKLLLAGPEGSGKTHLVHVWAERSGARIATAADLTSEDVPTLAAGPVALEDCCAVAGNRLAEEAMFHLHNMAIAEGHPILFTARTPAARWRLDLPDLTSRMQATPVAQLGAPDDALLQAVMMKLFADRQLSPSPETVPFLVRRIDRSFSAARRIVEALDSASLETARPINRRLAARVLDKSGL